MVTINDIARLAGVSRTTVSRVLNNSGYVGEEAKKKILAVIAETGYVPSEQAKSLRTKRTKVIGVILPKISTETASRVVDGIDKELSQHGYQILLASSNLQVEKEIEQLRLLQSRRVDGIVIVATNTDEKLMKEIHEVKIPIVVLGQDVKGVTSVIYNDYDAAKDVTTLLAEKGHRRIGFIGVSEKDPAVGYYRKKGYLDALTENGLMADEKLVKEGIFNIQSGYSAMMAMFADTSDAPTAVVAVTDRLAVGALQALREKNIRIPDDISLFGMGNSVMSEYLQPPLSTVEFYNEQAGKEAAVLLLEQLNKQEEVVNKKIIINYRLIERGSLL
ncbi:LacI family transcriptional regulator, sucrose operon repressor [Evansella caseinilytica]|uniref:LacI family transcriptional regulator, sucrose operon repressor n=1 Tax=Evansella caseinilytica TaxID=1503961 RepID=A0A1H3IJA6_9BACI|nr:LacI family DNA-binding transcriptional regulator [Evansella caseinilytica]SDY27790.1 LacI family transcriptional regulator, sucrose operon repressor [Evansella caseinilytica]